MTAVKQDQYLSIRDFIGICWQKKWWVISITGLFAVASVIVALSIPNQYKAQVLLGAFRRAARGRIGGFGESVWQYRIVGWDKFVRQGGG